jgi:hypothetical protein
MENTCNRRNIGFEMSLLFLTFALALLKVSDAYYKSLIELDNYGSCPQINNAQMVLVLNSLPTIVMASRTLVSSNEANVK